MAEKKSTSEKLNEEMLKYYQKQNEILMLNELQQMNKQAEQGKKKKELQQMGKKLKKMKDKELIDNISSIIIKTWETDGVQRISDVLSVLEVREWFLNKEIDVGALGLTESLTHDYRINEIYDYFSEYGMKERIRWSKIEINIQQKLKEWITQKNKKEFDEKVNTLVKRARDDNLYSVTSAHVKQFASELGIDTTQRLNILTNAVTTRLNKEFWSSEPKGKRTLTKSIKLEVFKRDNYTCHECGAGRDAELHVHHIIPVCRGGTDEMNNLITLCASCNQSIGDRIYTMKPEKSCLSDRDE